MAPVAPEALVALDAEIARLHDQAVKAADVFDRELARIKVDELLEQRHALTSGEE